MKRNYLSVSALKAFAKSPSHYLSYIGAGDRDQTPAMLLGEMCHCAVLEPDQFRKRYHAIPYGVDRRTKEGREHYNDLVAQANGAGAKLVTHEQHDLAMSMMQRSLASDHPTVKAIYEMRTEVQVEGEIAGVPFKGIVDAMNDDMIVELKTTTDGSPEAFARDAAKLGYFLQAAAYTQLTGIRDFQWVVAETVSPFNITVYTPAAHSLAMASAYLDDLIAQWVAWDGAPGGYPSGEIALPGWHPAMKSPQQLWS